MRRRFSTRLGPRLLVVLAVTLAAVGALQYFLVADRLTRDLVREQVKLHAADARSLERAAGAVGVKDPLVPVTVLLRAIDARPWIDDAVVADRSGRVVAAADPTEVGELENEPEVLQAARGGHSFAAVESPAGTGVRDARRYSYIAPVRIDGGRYAFEIERDRAYGSAAVAGMREQMIVALALGLALALGAFYLFGGRRVDALYRLALAAAARDGLTELDNHRTFKDELVRFTARARRRGAPGAVAVLDVDDFKFANDQHGHLHGDRVLRQLARVLREGRAEDRAFRLGGDEFALLLDGCGTEAAREALERVCAQARARLGGPTVSIGFSVGPVAGEDPETLWARADAAMYEAKHRGGSCVVSAGDLAPDATQLVAVEKVRAVRRLIADARVEIAFQPIWDLGRRRVLSFEALARPALLYGLAGPGEAFDVAERIGRGHELDAICRRAALAAAHRLPHDALLFLNVSPQSLDHESLAGERLVDEVRAAGLPPWRVVLEVTERPNAHLLRVKAECERLRALGFKIALDDVGAGNAGLEMLRSIVVDFVKVDREIVRAAPHDRKAQAVMQAVMAFARGAEAYVIAEGVEDDALLSFVAGALEADLPGQRIEGAQGFVLGRPAPTPDLEDGREALARLRDAARAGPPPPGARLSAGGRPDGARVERADRRKPLPSRNSAGRRC